MEKATQLSVALENVPGQLSRLCRVMAQAKVNIRGISVSDSADISTIRLIASDPAAAKTALREAGLCFVSQEVLIVELEDKPGALEEVAARLGDAGLNVLYIYGTGDVVGGKARLVIRVDDVNRARQALR
jgi:hypothetical protein